MKVYRHYKGGIYVVTGTAKHSETGEMLVVYQSVSNEQIWVRPYDMFFGFTEDGKIRFTQIEPEDLK